MDIFEIRVLNRAGQNLPFNSFSNLDSVGLETLDQYRPLALRTKSSATYFEFRPRCSALFDDSLNRAPFHGNRHLQDRCGGTEGGTNLFEMKYFDRVAYLAQSPQFYKEHGVAGFERVYETGHVYRAEPHASSRHLTEYYSLDVEFGFIDGPEDVIQLERELLTDMFEKLNKNVCKSARVCTGSRLASVDAGGALLGISEAAWNCCGRASTGPT